MNTNDVKTRGYRVLEEVRPGTQVELLDDTYCGRQLRKGERGTVRSYTNAGFRGIEATVEINGERLHGINAGLLAWVAR